MCWISFFAGFLCITRGLSLPSNVCPAGSYCPGVANSSQQVSVLCSPGNMCPPGSDRQVPCSPGTYQDLSGQVQKMRINIPSNVQKDSGNNSPPLWGYKEDTRLLTTLTHIKKKQDIFNLIWSTMTYLAFLYVICHIWLFSYTWGIHIYISTYVAIVYGVS